MNELCKACDGDVENHDPNFSVDSCRECQGKGCVKSHQHNESEEE